MVVPVKDYQWSETDEYVEIVVPLKGVKKAKTDVFASDVYVKVNFPPFIFELDLAEAVNEGESKAVVGDGVVRFHLIKQEKKKWGYLAFKGTKEELLQRRLDAQDRHRDRIQEQANKQKNEAREKDREAVRRQMKLEEEERAKRDMKIEEAKEKFDKQIEAANKTSKVLAEKEASKSLPPVRKTTTISISFSKRQFKTPERETYKEQEEEWLQKQTEARRAIAQAKESVEHDPLWFADKGKTFFQQGSIQNAINAFTSAIELDPSGGNLYSMRAACHLKANDPHASCSDASKALSLFQPPVPANAMERLKAHLRRGAALELLDDHESALFDYKKALEINPHDTKVAEMVERLSLTEQKQDGFYSQTNTYTAKI